MADDIFEAIYVDTDTDVNLLCEEINKKVEQIFNEEFEVGYKELKIIANNFESVYKDEKYNIKTLLKNYQQKNRKYKQYLRSSNNPETIEKWRSERDKASLLVSSAYRTLYSNMIIFSEAFNRYMGTKPSMLSFVYTNESGQPIVYNLPLSSILQLTYRGKFIESYTKQGKLEEILQYSEKAKKIELNEKDPPYAAYLGSYNRLERFFEIKKSHGGKGQKQGGYLMWKEGKTWFKAFVLNYGDLKESYVAVLNDNTPKLRKSIGKPKYFSHGLIGDFFNNYISKVSNLGALGAEDVEGEKFQFAVKGLNAQLPHLHQFYELAKKINEGEYALSEEIHKVQEEVASDKGQRNKIVEVLNNTSAKAAEDIIKNGFNLH